MWSHSPFGSQPFVRAEKKLVTICTINARIMLPPCMNTCSQPSGAVQALIVVSDSKKDCEAWHLLPPSNTMDFVCLHVFFLSWSYLIDCICNLCSYDTGREVNECEGEIEWQSPGFTPEFCQIGKFCTDVRMYKPVFFLAHMSATCVWSFFLWEFAGFFPHWQDCKLTCHVKCLVICYSLG